MSSKTVKPLGEIIKEALKERGLNKSAIAKKMNVSKQVINQIDRRKYFDLDFLKKLKDATGLDFTRYNTSNFFENIDDTIQPVTGDADQLKVEMSLAIKITATQAEISRMG